MLWSASGSPLLSLPVPPYTREVPAVRSKGPRSPIPIRYTAVTDRKRRRISLRHHLVVEPEQPLMKPLIIGIAGGTGSGKSTVARKVAEALPDASVAFLEMDAYYRDFRHLTLQQLHHVNWDHPDAFDVELLTTHLEALNRGEAVEMPVYEFATHSRSTRTRRIAPADVVVIDGILLLSDPNVRAQCDVKVFVDADPDIRLIRRIRRDTAVRGRTLESVLDQYLTTVQPMHLQFVEPSKRYADVIVPRGGSNTVAIEMIVAKIQRRLLARASLRSQLSDAVPADAGTL